MRDMGLAALRHAPAVPVDNPTIRGVGSKAPLVAACATAVLLPIASTFAFQLTNMRLLDLGASPLAIGISAGIQALGIVIVAPFTPTVARLIGPRATVLFGLLCAVAASLLMRGGSEAFWDWAVVRVLLAVGIAFIYTMGESLILKFPRLRSGTDGIGIYSSLLATGAALGPFCVAAVGTSGSSPLMLSVVLFVAAAVPLALHLSSESPTETRATHLTPALLRTVWVALAAAFVFGFLDSGAVGMLSLHGSLSGHGLGMAVSATAVAAAAAVVLQYPIARIVSRSNTRSVLCAISAASLFCIALISVTSAHPLALLLAAFVFGGMLDGFYTIGLVVFASSVSQSQMMGGNACLVGVCGLGEVMGPIATGAGMSYWGPDGLPIVVALALILFLVVLLATSPRGRLLFKPAKFGSS